jgi:Cu2+-exporting ATPase
MSCCAPGAELDFQEVGPSAEEISLASRPAGDGLRRTDLSVPDMHCGACLQKVEVALTRLDGVEEARANLSLRRIGIVWRGDTPPPMLLALNTIGYCAHLYDTSGDGEDLALSKLLRSLAVAGFAASNIMLLSVSVWSGAEAATRDLFHWISAAIALPALAYSGQVFLRSAWRALRHGQTNMDVAISIGVLLAFGMSLYETIRHGPHAYFDAAVSLLFFLLIGRTLDHFMRERARQAVSGLARLSARGAMAVRSDGAQIYLPIDEIEPGMTILLAAGERVPVDGRVIRGRSDLDRSLVSGESAPQQAAEGTELQAGILNLTGPLTMVATAAAQNSFLAEMIGMMEAAEAGRSRYRRIADRAPRLYAPVVHATAFLTFAGWMITSGDAHRAVTIAIAVLIVTCPCALGLAVPMVHVAAVRRLFELGIMARDGGALERLANIDTVIFDKTGTLTAGRPRLSTDGGMGSEALALASAIARHSRHPYSRAFAALGDGRSPLVLDEVSEHPGAGLEARKGPAIYRLGRPDWAAPERGAPSNPAVVLSKDGHCIAAFQLADCLRSGAREAIAELKAAGFGLEILSGDNRTRVGEVASELGLSFSAGARPSDKVAQIKALQQAGHRVLMVGDGLNDAPALGAADVSMAPGSAADIGRNAADLVFPRDSLAGATEFRPRNRL